MEWEDWLQEPLLWSTPEDSGVPRCRIITNFVKEGLIPLFKSRGYLFKCDAKTLCSRIATLLYNNQERSSLESDWSFGQENTDHLPEEKDHYYHIMNHSVWDRFWSKWIYWDDISPNTFRGEDRRRDIEEYCWTQLDLEGSPQTRKILDMLGIYEDTGGIDGGNHWHGQSWKSNKDHQKTVDDVYLKEAIESGQFGGYRR